ncbi:THUMP domain-containing protein 1 [Sorochytrium milnesiophthora]
MSTAAKRKGNGEGRSNDGDRASKKQYKKPYKQPPQTVEHGSRGFFVTSTQLKERQSVREVTDLLRDVIKHKHPDVIPDEPAAAEHDDADNAGAGDIEASVEQELADLRAASKKKKADGNSSNNNVLVPFELGIRCLSFIKLNGAAAALDPSQLVEQLFENIVDAAEDKRPRKVRFTMRIVPFQTVCGANAESIVDTVTALLQQYHPTVLGDTPSKTPFAVQCKIRNCDKLDKDDVVAKVAKVMIDKGHLVHLDNPQLNIVVEAFKTVAGVSIVLPYVKYRKFNLHEVYEKGVQDRSLEVKEKKKADV